MTATTPPSADKRMGKIAAAGVAASVAEWLDFFIYTTAAALVLGKLFFPSLSPGVSTIASFGTLAVGFLARPVGGIVAGQLGDKHGRRPVLVGAMLLMGVATVGIGLLPTYATIGVWAPTLLVLLRLVQGLGVGAQWGGAALLLTEHAPVERRGFYGSMVQLGAVAGSALATGIFYAITSLMSKSAFESWGWRLPFLAGIIVVFVGLYIQSRIEDTPVFQQLQEEASTSTSAPAKQPVLDVLRNHSRAVLQAAGAFLVVNAAFYVLSTGMVDFGTRIVGLSRGTMLGLVLGAGIGYNVLQRYLRGRSEPLPPLSAEGYFDSGDLGSVDDDERSFTYEGRAGEALRLRGFLVQPAEIELFLIGHPAVEMVKVVGAERDGRPVAVAFVTAAAGQTVDTEELLSWCRDELAAFKVPERVIVVDTMPFTSGTNGSKIKAAELRRQAAELPAP